MNSVTADLVRWCLDPGSHARPEWLEPWTLSVANWVMEGQPVPAPAFLKREIVADIVAKSGLQHFIETGTHAGDTTERIASMGLAVDSVELAEHYHAMSKARLAPYEKVKLWLGDSGKLFPEILAPLKQPAVFYLDGHYSGGDTALGDKVTPISEELEAIYHHPVKGHVILIDDARCFGGGTYPLLADMIAEMQHHLPDYRIYTESDIVRALPPSFPG